MKVKELIEKVIFYILLIRNILLIPLTVIMLLIEWYHFNISNELVGISRKYQKWLGKIFKK